MTESAQRPGDILYENNCIYLSGNWTRSYATTLPVKIAKLRPLSGRKIRIDASKLEQLDTAGALILRDFIKWVRKKGLTFELQGLGSGHQTLLDLIASEEEKLAHPPHLAKPRSFFEVIGRETIKKCIQLQSYLAFIGQFTYTLLPCLRHFSPLQWKLLFNSIDEMGYCALPIIALLSFLIGVVLTYQLGLQLQSYGAHAFIVSLTGQAVLREFGPLITAIIGAGRTSSAITAALGTMKINEEIDALRTMGFSPFDILVIPRVLAALIAFPLLMVWANIFGIVGGMVMSKALFSMQYGDFLYHFREVINLSTLIVGLSKAPIFALIISMVGCFQGLSVTATADNVGAQTTKGVVQAIFLIIIADAAYSILYSKLNI